VFESIAGSIVWFLANVLYIDQRRKGKGGWARIILFFMGLPLTWLWLFLVKEGSAPELVEPPDDANAILAEIRREKQLRAGSELPGELAPPRSKTEGPRPGRGGPSSS
jgi:hypothetical protein